MRKYLAFTAFLLSALSYGNEKVTSTDEMEAHVRMNLLRRDHIQANVPVVDRFPELITQAVRPAFTERHPKEKFSIEYELLRKAPTQVGIAYPKYYAWVWVKGTKGNVLNSGAARLAAEDQERFRLTDFLTAKEINEDPEGVKKVFPAALNDAIISKAKVAPKAAY